MKLKKCLSSQLSIGVYTEEALQKLSYLSLTSFRSAVKLVMFQHGILRWIGCDGEGDKHAHKSSGIKPGTRLHLDKKVGMLVNMRSSFCE